MQTELHHFQRALRAADRGEHAVATHHLRKLVRRAPREGLYHLLLADQLHRQDLFAAAAEAYRRVLALGGDRLPPPAAVHAALASALEGAGRLEEAETEYRRALELSPDATHWVALGHHLEARGRRREARRCYLEALRRDGGHPDALSALGNLQIWRNPERAERSYRRALRRRSRHAEALTGLGYALLNLERHDEAERVLERAVQVDGSARPHVYLAHVHEVRQHHEKALEALDRAQRADPGDPHPLFALGDHHRRWGDAEAARRAYLEALRLVPDCADALLRLGLLYHERLDDDRQAEICLERGLARAPYHPWRARIEEEVLPQLGKPGPP